MRAMTATDLGGKSIRNYIGTLSALFEFAMHPRGGWASVNPVKAVTLPAWEPDTEIHYLTVLEVETLASAAVEGEYQALDRALYVTAAMTGLRQGELLALRWSDVDFQLSASASGALTCSASSTRPRAGAGAAASR
jgi:integrase